MPTFAAATAPLARLLTLLALLATLIGCYSPTVVESSSAESPWINPDGSIRWPPDEGFKAKPSDVEIAVGVRLERWGYPGGTFVAPVGVPPNDLSLAPGTLKKPHYVYEVLKPLPALEGTAAPWFGEPGGGIQYDLVKSVEHWIEAGFLSEATLAGDAEKLAMSLDEAIEREMVSLAGGLPVEAHCLEQWIDGTWRTYYSEKGRRTELKTFATEAEAREDLQKRIAP